MTTSLPAANAPPPSSRTPALALLLLFLLLALSHLSPQEAYPAQAAPIGLGLLLVFLLAAIHSLRARNAPTGAHDARLTILVFSAAAAWALWWGIRQGNALVPALSRAAVATIFQGALVFAAACLLVRASALHALRAVLFVVALASIIAAHGIYQVLGPEDWPGTHAALAARLAAESGSDLDPLRDGLLHALREGRASGRLGSPNVFAGLLALAFPLALALAASPSRKPPSSTRHPSSLVPLLSALLLAWGIVLSGSRGGSLALLVGAGTYLVLILAGRVSRNRIAFAAAVSLLILAGLGASGTPTPTPAPPDAPPQLASSPQPASSRWLGTGTVRQRLLYWQAGLDVWRENWLSGAAPGAFAVRYPQVRRPGAQETAFAHNWAVQWGAESGIAGLGLFALWAGACIGLGVRAWRSALGEKPGTCACNAPLAAGLLAAAAAVLAHGLVEFTLQFRELYLDFALVLGTLAGAGLASAAPADSAAAPVRQPRAFVPAMLAVAAAAAGWYTNEFAPGLAAAAREDAEYLLEEERDPAGAESAYTRALRWQPDDPRLYEARAFVRRALGHPFAGADLQRALQLQPTSARLHESMARWEADDGRIAEAIAWQRKAIALHPLDGSHRLQLADLLLAAGDAAAARQAVDSTDGLLLSEVEKLRRQRLLERLGGAD